MAQKPLGIHQWIALFATIFVVGGVVAILQTRPGADASEEGVEVLEEVRSGRVVVFVDAGRVYLADAASGAGLRVCDASGVTRIEEVTRDGIVMSAPTGDRVRLGFDCVVIGDVEASPVQIVEPGADGVPHVRFASSGADVALVASNGRPYREPQIVGWMDDTRVALVALRGDVRTALAVRTDGTVEVLATLPEVVGGFAAGGGAFWYVTASPGPGIEFGPQGPSAIHRVRAAGDDAVVAGDDVFIVDAFLVGPLGGYAYVMDGTLFVGKDGAPVPAGTGVPIGWSDDGRALVLNAQGALSFIATDGSVTETGVILPPGVVSAWSVDVVH